MSHQGDTGVVRAIAPAVADADHVPHDAAAKEANRERLTPRIAVRRNTMRAHPRHPDGIRSRSGGIVTAIPVLQDGYARLGKKLRSRCVRGRHAKPGPSVA